MTNIKEKFADFTELFSADGYNFLLVRAKLEQVEKAANSGDTDALALIDIVNKCHKLFMYLSEK